MEEKLLNDDELAKAAGGTGDNLAFEKNDCFEGAGGRFVILYDVKEAYSSTNINTDHYEFSGEWKYVGTLLCAVPFLNSCTKIGKWNPKENIG